jgi:hypothetical protein
MMVSQIQSPNYFLLAFLEDYRTDPARAQPLLAISIFDDMAETKGVALVRCDVIYHGIDEDEGLKICKCLLGRCSLRALRVWILLAPALRVSHSQRRPLRV